MVDQKFSDFDVLTDFDDISEFVGYAGSINVQIAKDVVKNFITDGDAASVATSEAYADTGDATVTTAVEAYADAGDATTLSTAESYADTADTAILGLAEDYTDAAIAGLATVATTGAYADLTGLPNLTLKADVTYVDTQDAGVLSDAEDYTDSAIAGLSAVYVPQTTTVNGHALSSNVTVTFNDVMADGDKGDVVVGGSGTTLMFDSSVVTAAAKTVLDDASASAMLTTLGAQPVDSDLTTIAGLTATTDNFIQSKSSAWASRTPTQVTADLIGFVGDSGSGGTKGLVPAPSTGDAMKYLKGDGTWGTVVAGSGDVVGPSSSVDSEIALFNSTTGKLLKRASTTGILKGTSGVLSAATAGTDYYNPGGTDVAVADGGTGSSTQSGARTNLGLAIGSNVQAWDADLDAFAGLSSAADKVPYYTGTNAMSTTDFTSVARTLVGGASQLAMKATGLGMFFSSIKGVQVLTATGTYTPTSGTRHCLVIVVGGGGGGGGVGTTAGTGIGGMGGMGEVRLAMIQAAATTGPMSGFSVTVGTGGAGATSGANNGTNGNGTTFDPSGAFNAVTAAGGTGGLSSTGATTGGAGTTGTGSGGIIFAKPTIGTTITSSFQLSAGHMFGEPEIRSLLASQNGSPRGGGWGGGGWGGFDTGTTARSGGTGTDGVVFVIEFGL